MQPSRFAALWVVLLACIPASLRAQCDPVFGSANGRPDLAGDVSCSTTWDPDGAGPASLRLVVGGNNLVGGVSAAGTRVATFDGTQWTTLGVGPGTTGQVLALTVWNGQLVAGGTFTGGGTDRIAMWNGTSWQQVGTGAPNAVTGLTVWNGQLVAVGYFSTGSMPSIRTWNGSVWTTLPNPPSLQIPRAVAVYQGWLCVGGSLSSGSVITGVLERWNGATWATSITAVDAAFGFGQIASLAVRSSLAVGGSDTLYVGGTFTSIGGTAANALASTTSVTSPAWSTVGANTIAGCRALHVRSSGLTGYSIVAAFSATANLVRQFSSTTGTWSTLGPSGTSLNALTFYGGSYHGGQSSSPAACVRWDGTAWVPTTGLGLVGEVRALTRSGNDIVAGGAFTATTSAPLNRIARWNGSTFEAIDTGITGTSVDALLTRSNGDVIAGGLFTLAGSTSAANLARWTGAVWAAFGTGTNDQVLALAELPNGDLIAGGKFTMAGGVSCNRVARWNGSAWSSLNFGFNGDVLALAVASDGTLFAAGSFTLAGATSCNRIARWNGVAWQPLGAGANADVHALAFRPNGDLVAVGAFTQAGGLSVNRCAVWNGAFWSSTGSGSGDPAPARSVCVLPNGDVVAGRGFHQPGVGPDAGIARWNGAAWSGFGTGIAATTVGTSANVRAIVQRRDGTLVLGGDFGFAAGLVARGLATLTATCPASSSSYGAGCSSGNGPLTITADTLPWIGTSFRTTTTGIPANSLSLAVLGLSQVALPLSTILAEGQPGCSLLVAPDILLLQTNGPANTATSSFVLANDPALVGIPFFQQTIPCEFTGGGALLAVRASNALAQVCGIF